MTHDLDDLRRMQSESEAHQPDCPCGICRPLHLRLKAELEAQARNAPHQRSRFCRCPPCTAFYVGLNAKRDSNLWNSR